MPRPPEQNGSGRAQNGIEAEVVANSLPRPPEQGLAKQPHASAESEDSEEAAIDALVMAARSWSPEFRVGMLEFLVPKLAGKPLEALLRVDQELKAAAR